MLFIAGGAYAGKRQYLRSRESSLYWHSSYDGKRLADWHQAWGRACDASALLVLEGWELWIADDLKQGKSPAAVRKEYRAVIQHLKQLEEEARAQVHAEASGNHCVALLMLEIGRGIVPMLPDERTLRDAAGWLQQDAAAVCEEAVYVWHGLARAMKQAFIKPQLE